MNEKLICYLWLWKITHTVGKLINYKESINNDS